MTGEGGTYTLLVQMDECRAIDVGALGTISFEQGWYAYVGSALGPGGFARVDRHRELASGDRDTRHWHIDYLLADDHASIERVVRTSEVDVECSIADAIPGEAIPDFGCSDCGCGSHLYYHPDDVLLLTAIENAHENVQSAGW